MNRMTIPLGDILTQSGHHRAGNRELPVGDAANLLI